MTARGVDFPDKISVRSGLRHVERFRGTCVGHAVFQENLRLVDMPKGDIGERGCSQCIPVKRNMLCITAMEHEDPGTSGCRKRDVVDLCLGNLGSVIAESVNFGVQLLKIDGREVLVHQKCHVRRPGKAEECGTLPDPVMVSGNDDNSGPGDCREQIVDFLQVAGQRLAVEQIAGDQKEIGAEVSRVLNDSLECQSDRLFPLFAPGLITVRDHAPVDIGGVDKFHRFLPV